MALFRRVQVEDLAKAVAAEIAKQSVPGLGQLPAGTTTSTLEPVMEERTSDFVPLPREPQWPYGPGVPLLPIGIDPRLPSGRTQPRISEFPISVNLQLSRQLRPWKVLRDAAEIDVIRRCCEVRKNHLTSLDWDITLSDKAVERIMAATGDLSPGTAQRAARERYAEDIGRLSSFWEYPDRPNGLDFPAWLSMLLEERFVVDAATVYPRRNLGGEIISLECIDGSSVKPILDHRGGVPLPPNPAYQQILHGFPRGEFTASVNPDGEWFADQLLYRPRMRRTWTPYGFSNVEQSLSIVDIYLKRMGWIRGEFDDSARPELWAQSDMDVSPEQIAMYEAIFNDALAGQVQERRKLKLLPKGIHLNQMMDFAEKFQPELDEFLIKLLCMCWDVMPTEIGFPPKSGIGGKGHQEGEASATYRKGIRPEVVWVSALLTEISRTYLGMPQDLAFTFIGYQQEDQKVEEEAADLRIRSARSTINEERARVGKPLFDFPEADEPLVVTGSGLVFVNGAMQAQQDAAITPPAVDAPPVSATDARQSELVRFAAYARKRAKSGKWRDFTFEHIDSFDAEALNTAGSHGDLDAVKALLDRARASSIIEVASPDPVVNVAAPVVNVAPAQVDVAAPTVNVAAPEVSVSPVVNVPQQQPVVKVSAPVTVSVPEAPAPVVHVLEQRSTKVVKRDAKGRIVGIEET